MLALQVGFPFVSLQELGFEIHLFVPVKKLHLTMEELPEHLAAELSVLAEDAAVLVAGWLESERTCKLIFVHRFININQKSLQRSKVYLTRGPHHSKHYLCLMEHIN